jgi:urea transport system permease protein
MDTLVQILAQGLAIGAVFLLGALGLMIIYGVMGVINLAHGDFVMLGAYTMALLAGSITPLGGIVAAFVVVAALGVLFDLVLVRFLYHKPVASMLGTWGLGMVIRQVVILVLGPNLKYVGVPIGGTLALGFGVEYSAWRAVLVVASALLAAAVALLMLRTPFGLKMRAVIANPAVAQSMGLRVERVNRWAFAFGCGLAGLAGALVAPVATVFPNMGLRYLVGAFLVVILCGLGSIRAAVGWSVAIGIGTAAIAIPFNDILGQIVVWTVALCIIAARRQTISVARV